MWIIFISPFQKGKKERKKERKKESEKERM